MQKALFMNSDTFRSVLTAALMLSPGIVRAATPITSVPFTISAPGEYELEADLTTDARYGILVDASDVVVNLKGHTLAGRPTGSSEGISAAKTGSSNITVRNGSITGFDFAVYSSGVRKQILIEDLAITNAPRGGIFVAICDYGLIQNCSMTGIKGSPSDGIRIVNSSGLQVKNNRVSHFLRAFDNTGGEGNVFIANYADDADAGFTLDRDDKYQDNLTTRCRTRFTGGIAIGNGNG